MGHFQINLPDNRVGDVRWGKVVKTSTLIRLLPWIKGNIDEKTGYIIKVEPALEQKTEFRLFKTRDGNWSEDEDGSIQLTGEAILAIKNAIEKHENLESKRD